MKKLIGIILSSSIIAAFTGCGNNSSSGSSNSTSAATTAAETTADTAAETTAATTEATVDETVFPLTYVDGLGREVVIEKAPERIAVTYLPYWEMLIALDLQPVAASNAETYNTTWEPFLLTDYNTDEVIDIGYPVNAEKLLEVAPDLIFATSQEEVDAFEGIAPVVVLGAQAKMDWVYGLTETAKVVGREAIAAQKVAETEERLAGYREELDAKYNDQTVMLISVMSKANYYSALRPTFFDKETGLGLNAPEGYPEANQYEQVTLEAIAQMNPDYIFLAVFDGSEAIIEELGTNSVWQSLTAVQNGHVYTLDGAAHSPSILATEYTVQKVVEALLAD